MRFDFSSIRARLILGAALVLAAFMAIAGTALQRAYADSVRAAHYARLQGVVYLLLAGCLFAELGYTQVWHRLTSGLHGWAGSTPTASALRQARQRLGPAPLRALFDLLEARAEARGDY